MTAAADTFAWLLARARAQQARAKPVHLTNNPVGQARPAWMKPATHLHGSRYSDFPVPRAPGDNAWYDIDLENLRHLARICRDGGTIHGGGDFDVTAGAPVIFDWEHFYGDPANPRPEYKPRPDLSQTDAFNIFAGYIRTFRAEAPSVPVGYSGPHWFAGDTLDAMVATTTTTRIIIDNVNLLCPQHYPTRHDHIAEDIAGLRREIRLAKYLFPDKKYMPLVTHRYAFEEAEVGPEGRPLMEMLYDEADGLMAWGGRDRLVEVVGAVVLERQ